MTNPMFSQTIWGEVPSTQQIREARPELDFAEDTNDKDNTKSKIPLKFQQAVKRIKKQRIEDTEDGDSKETTPVAAIRKATKDAENPKPAKRRSSIPKLRRNRKLSSEDVDRATKTKESYSNPTSQKHKVDVDDSSKEKHSLSKKTNTEKKNDPKTNYVKDIEKARDKNRQYKVDERKIAKEHIKTNVKTNGNGSLDDNNEVLIEPIEDFDQIYKDIVDELTDDEILESVAKVDDIDKVETKFEEIIHDYDVNNIQPIKVLVKQKSLHDIPLPKKFYRKFSLEDSNESETPTNKLNDKETFHKVKVINPVITKRTFNKVHVQNNSDLDQNDVKSPIPQPRNTKSTENNDTDSEPTKQKLTVTILDDNEPLENKNIASKIALFNRNQIRDRKPVEKYLKEEDKDIKSSDSQENMGQNSANANIKELLPTENTTTSSDVETLPRGKTTSENIETKEKVKVVNLIINPDSVNVDKCTPSVTDQINTESNFKDSQTVVIQKEALKAKIVTTTVIEEDLRATMPNDANLTFVAKRENEEMTSVNKIDDKIDKYEAIQQYSEERERKNEVNKSIENYTLQKEITPINKIEDIHPLLKQDLQESKESKHEANKPKENDATRKGRVNIMISRLSSQETQEVARNIDVVPVKRSVSSKIALFERQSSQDSHAKEFRKPRIVEEVLKSVQRRDNRSHTPEDTESNLNVLTENVVKVNISEETEKVRLHNVLIENAVKDSNIEELCTGKVEIVDTVTVEYKANIIDVLDEKETLMVSVGPQLNNDVFNTTSHLKDEEIAGNNDFQEYADQNNKNGKMDKHKINDDKKLKNDHQNGDRFKIFGTVYDDDKTTTSSTRDWRRLGSRTPTEIKKIDAEERVKKMQSKERVRSNSLAHIEVGDLVRGKVNQIIQRINSREELDVDEKRDIIPVKERPRKKSVSDMIAMFEVKIF